jgi:hypothetical protein
VETTNPPKQRVAGLIDDFRFGGFQMETAVKADESHITVIKCSDY